MKKSLKKVVEKLQPSVQPPAKVEEVKPIVPEEKRVRYFVSFDITYHSTDRVNETSNTVLSLKRDVVCEKDIRAIEDTIRKDLNSTNNGVSKVTLISITKL